ncbi:MAG: CopG family transcriptional regulator [Archangium sp.]|nr:CopG family transcriptional regulator [Archangium sp.]
MPEEKDHGESDHQVAPPAQRPSHAAREEAQRLARRRNVSRSALVREALELLTSDRGGETFIDRVSQYVGAGDDLPADILTNPKHMKVYGRRPRL